MAKTEPRVADGGWYPTTPNKRNQWGGRCEKCYRKTVAVQLTLKVLPFGRGERYVCGRLKCVYN